MIDHIYVFFANSALRWELLSRFFGNEEVVGHIKLKRLNPTRWSSRDDALNAIYLIFKDILRALSNFIHVSRSKNEQNEAKSHMENFYFVFQVVLHSKVLTTTNTVSKFLQNAECDLFFASSLLLNAQTEINKFSNNYETAKQCAFQLSAK